MKSKFPLTINGFSLFFCQTTGWSLGVYKDLFCVVLPSLRIRNLREKLRNVFWYTQPICRFGRQLLVSRDKNEILPPPAGTYPGQQCKCVQADGHIHLSEFVSSLSMSLTVTIFSILELWTLLLLKYSQLHFYFKGGMSWKPGLLLLF